MVTQETRERGRIVEESGTGDRRGEGKMGSYTECGWEPRGADVPQGEMPDAEQGEEGAGAGGPPGRAGGAAAETKAEKQEPTRRGELSRAARPRWEKATEPRTVKLGKTAWLFSLLPQLKDQLKREEEGVCRAGVG